MLLTRERLEAELEAVMQRRNQLLADKCACDGAVETLRRLIASLEDVPEPPKESA